MANFKRASCLGNTTGNVIRRWGKVGIVVIVQVVTAVVVVVVLVVVVEML
jgi:hypothetical protein